MVSLHESGTIERITQELAASLILGDFFLMGNVQTVLDLTNVAYLNSWIDKAMKFPGHATKVYP